MKEFTNSTSKASRFVAILRGLEPENCIQVATEIYKQGIELIEFPINLNKKKALICVESLVKKFPDKKVGIGTTLTKEDVVDGYNAGVKFIVAPNFNPKVIEKTKELGLYSIPGILSPTEALEALNVGADALKIFPISAFPPSAVKNLVGILPPKTILMPTGSILPAQTEEYFKAGISKIGLGSAIYNLRDNADSISQKIKQFLAKI